MRTNYVLVDYENVRPETFDLLGDEHFRILLFVGASQSKLPFELVASVQRLGCRAEYVKISGNGPNAMDFHIAYSIGRLTASDPGGYFHIVSKDTGFDPLIQHLKANGVLARRVHAVSEIPLLKAANAKAPEERFESVVARLQRNKAARPRTIATLGSTIASFFQKQVTAEEVAAVIQGLRDRGYVALTDGKLAYSLPHDP